MPYSKRHNLLKKFYEKCCLKASFRPFCVCKKLSTTSIGKWLLNIWKLKIWLSQEWKELSKWNKKYLSLFHECSFGHTKQTSKNVVDTTFKNYESTYEEQFFLIRTVFLFMTRTYTVWLLKYTKLLMIW